VHSSDRFNAWVKRTFMAWKINKLVVIGAGLIGGSFALALKSEKAVKRVVGVGRRPKNLAHALELGIIDETDNIGAALKGADLVLVAVPVAQTASVLNSVTPHLDSSTIVTDAGSTKQDVVAAARRALGAHFARFVPGHPIAGGEQSGAQAARADLFRGRNVLLTPLAETDRHALDYVRDAWLVTGATVREMLPEEHDQVLAAVSHLPHALAFALVDCIAGRENANTLFSFAAAGFRDFTRIAGSSPEMWRDICVANRDALLAELKGYQRELAQLERLIGEGDAAALEQLFTRAREAREKWLVEKGEQ
jgi:prephenate dehydrogenase